MSTSKFVLYISVISLILSCSQKPVASIANDSNSKHEISKTNNTSTQFLHGVASGDPMQDRVIIWTRISNITKEASVIWEVSENENFASLTSKGKLTTNNNVDYTVKVDVNGLQSGKQYYYRFIHNEQHSPIGKTKTLASIESKEVHLGVVSCSNYEFGYFNAYEGLANEELDAILHLGDYIYEYAPGKYGAKDFDRKHLPENELLTLQDYRTRYAQYRTDKSLQKAHQLHPFINDLG